MRKRWKKGRHACCGRAVRGVWVILKMLAQTLRCEVHLFIMCKTTFFAWQSTIVGDNTTVKEFAQSAIIPPPTSPSTFDIFNNNHKIYTYMYHVHIYMHLSSAHILDYFFLSRCLPYSLRQSSKLQFPQTLLPQSSHVSESWMQSEQQILNTETLLYFLRTVLSILQINFFSQHHYFFSHHARKHACPHRRKLFFSWAVVEFVIWI